MVVAAYKGRLSGLRIRRSIMAALVAAMYLLTGALHGLCDLDVTNPAGNGAVLAISTAVAADTGVAGQSEKGISAERHCHGCFAASVSQPASPAAVIELRYAAPQPPRVHLADVMLDTETPPPKHLS
jgi:hypothetical protein